VKVVKNKVAPPFREAIFDIYYGQGINKWSEIIDLAIQLDIIQKSGSWFSMGEERIGQGKDSVKTYLMNNPDIAAKIEGEDVTVHKVSYRLTQLVKSGVAVKEDVKIPGWEGQKARKIAGYRLAD
jgi:recombination protein RecA